MPSIVEVREDMAEKSKFLADVYHEAGGSDALDLSKITMIRGDNNYKASELKRLMDEINELGREYDRLENLANIGRMNEMTHERMNAPSNGSGLVFPGNGNGSGPGAKALVITRPGQLRAWLNESKAYRNFQASSRGEVELEIPDITFKTLITLSTVNAQAERRGPIDMALEDRTVGDLALQGETQGNTIEYYEETTVTNAAATVAEGGTKPESAFAWTLRTESVRKIAHWVPATKESLDDVAWLESHLRGRMAFGIQRAEEVQILTGDGIAPNILGYLNRVGIQTQAKGGDPTPDAIYRGMQKVRGASGSGFAEPTAYVTHPNDWTDVKLLRTTDGIYIWGNPSDEGPDRIWGKEVRQTTAITEGTGLVGAFRPHSEVVRREGVTIILSTEHSTYAVENKVAIIAEERLALAVYRPAAFATITGI